MVPALAPEERRRDRPEGHGRNRRLVCAMNTKWATWLFQRITFFYFNFPTCPGDSDLFKVLAFPPCPCWGSRPIRGRALGGRHIWAHHRLCLAIGCGPYAAACQQDGLPPPAVLTLIILVSPRTYRKSLCHFKIDSGRAAAQSPNKAHMNTDFVHVTDRHSSLDINLH